MAKTCIFDLIEIVGKQLVDTLIGRAGKDSLKIRSLIDK